MGKFQKQAMISRSAVANGSRGNIDLEGMNSAGRHKCPCFASRFTINPVCVIQSTEWLLPVLTRLLVVLKQTKNDCSIGQSSHVAQWHKPSTSAADNQLRFASSIESIVNNPSPPRSTCAPRAKPVPFGRTFLMRWSRYRVQLCFNYGSPTKPSAHARYFGHNIQRN